MQQIDAYETRLEMATMHDFFLGKIEHAVKDGNHIEACWLIYACLENRFFRVLDKYKRDCKYCIKGRKCRKSSNQLALSTKVACVERLFKANVECISKSFEQSIFDDTRQWVKRRNCLMHNLLALGEYEEHFNDDFKELSEEGVALLGRVYGACTAFRKIFFSDKYVFRFPEECMESCTCKPRNEMGSGDSQNQIAIGESDAAKPGLG